MEKRDRVIALVEKYANGKNAQFAKFLGVSPQTISAWISRNTLDYDLIFTKCVGISPYWLLTGEGEMEKSSGSSEGLANYALIKDQQRTISRLLDRIDELEGKKEANQNVG